MHEYNLGLCPAAKERPRCDYEICTVQARPSTVVSLKDWPTVKEMLVVRTLVEVLMVSSSPCWLISTAGLEAAATAIFLKNTLTPDPTQTQLSLREMMSCFDPTGRLSGVLLETAQRAELL